MRSLSVWMGFFCLNLHLHIILHSVHALNFMNRFNWLIILILSISSCRGFVDEKLELAQLQIERLSEINWDSVDGLPSPPGCYEIEYSHAFSPCFLNFMSQTLSKDQKLLGKIRSNFGDTLYLKLVVDIHGAVRVRLHSEENKMDPLKVDLLADLESLISNKSWTPAIKQGIPVQVDFDYNLILQYAD